MKDEAPHRAGCIDTVREALKVDAALPEFVHQQHEIPHASPKTIQFPDHQRVPFIQCLKELF